MKRKITWLHISDIHFYPKKEWRDNPSREKLLEYLKETFKANSSLKPDLIFCTGDIAFGETAHYSMSQQYEQAKEFFSQLLNVCGNNDAPLPTSRLFVVPGNHDINRKRINFDAQETLIRFAKEAEHHNETINQRFNDKSTEFIDTIKRLDEYGKFVEDFLPHQHDPAGRHHYTRTIEINDLSVGIAGFNSAWTCAGPEDDRNIWLAAEWQFNNSQATLKNADIRIGLIHHPTDWLNSADRNIATKRIGKEFDFWLHGHTHNAWVTPIQSHIVIAAGAVGAKESEEFGVNFTSLDINTLKGITSLHNKKSSSNGWTIAPIADHAPNGMWQFDLPLKLRERNDKAGINTQLANQSFEGSSSVNDDFINRYLTQKLEIALRSFPSQPRVWVNPSLSTKAEIAQDANSALKIDIEQFVANPRSTFIKAPPQYGETCLAHFLALKAWQQQQKLWLFLDAHELKPHLGSINEATLRELNYLGATESDIKCVIVDSWTSNDNESHKLLKNICNKFKDIPIICLQQIDMGSFAQIDTPTLDREFDTLYLWALERKDIRQIVADYNQLKPMGDEDAVTARVISDLEVLNLHRTPLNCLTLLKVSEIDFEESPVNRSEMIKRVLFLLFNLEDIPTYKSRPDLKDCEYVLGHFCEVLIREGTYAFPRDKFLLETQKCCKERLIDLETQVVFDVLYENNILVKRGSLFYFKFSYWIFYFAAQRMHHEPEFATFIFDDLRYAQHPELIEFYTGIDRRRDDALEILIRDIKKCSETIKNKTGLPSNLNPYEFATWKPSPETESQMQQMIAEGVMESTLPAEIKDQYADRSYDKQRPYDQSIAGFLSEYSFTSMMQTMRAGARALRNSDYVSPEIKRKLLLSILQCWEEASKVLFVVLPVLAEKGSAVYDGAGFVLNSDFGDTPQERFMRIFSEIPYNVVSWNEDDLYSRKMGPLLIDQLSNPELSDISKHELVLLLIHKRPRDWHKEVQRYISQNKRNSFYLFDVYKALRAQYSYSFASPQTLKDIEHLIKMAATKHVTGDKEPSLKSINKVKFIDNPVPEREL